MNEFSGKNSKKKRAFFTIAPYTEQEKRILNGSVPNTIAAPAVVVAASSVPPPPPPPLPLPSKASSNEDSVEMQSIESFKLKETPNSVIPKPPATYFPAANSSLVSNGSPRHTTSGKLLNGSKDVSFTAEITAAAAAATATATSNADTLDTPKTTTTNSSVVSPQNLKSTNAKIAVRIGAYEGEAKQPAKLDFLSQQLRVEKNGTDEVNGPVVSRLQNELAATLQRSNLRKKTDGEIQLAAKSINENTSDKETTTTTTTASSESNKLTQGNVEKLASALSNRVTIRVNPEDGGR